MHQLGDDPERLEGYGYIGRIGGSNDEGPTVLVLYDSDQMPLARVPEEPLNWSWGYNGEGPRRLARSILLDLLGREQYDALTAERERAGKHVPLDQAFKDEIISRLDQDRDFTLPCSQVAAWVEGQRP